VDDAHSLLKQSCKDLRGETHGDGWGIGYYDGETPRVVRSPTAARESPEYDTAARQIHSPIVLAHVRQASVGSRLMENAHPFQYGRWLFMHNGTVTGFAEIRERVLAETDADLRENIQGTTDSEHVFYWLLSRLRRAGETAEGPAKSLDCLTRVIAEAIPVLDSLSQGTNPSEPARLNFAITDGVSLVVSRFKHNLHWRLLSPAGEGDPDADAAESSERRAVLVASEPIGDETWAVVPDGHVLSIACNLTTRFIAI